MARDIFQTTITRNITVNGQVYLEPLASVAVHVYLPGTTTYAAIYGAETGGSQLPNPITTPASGAVEFFAEAGQYSIRHVDTIAPARIADRTFRWNSVPASARGIPSSLLSEVSLSDLATAVQAMLWKTGDVRSVAYAVTAGSEESGWLLCDGRAVSRTTYAALFAKIGTTYGVGDGSTTFNLPDPRGRAIIGAGSGTGLTARALGAKVGAETTARADLGFTDAANTMPNTQTHNNNGVFQTASPTTGNNVQPSIAFNVLIKT